MAGYDGALRFDTRIDTKGFNQGTKQITKNVNGISAAFKKLGGVMIGVFAIKGLVKLASTALDVASDITEVQNVVDTAFGDMAYKCEEFAKTSIEQFGMSKLAAKQYASTYMAMGKGMGLASKDAADMAIETTKRVGDVASFYNQSFSEVDTMMKSIWTGETESLKRIGVVMTETNLAAFALSQGITKDISVMTQAEKTQLRYAFVMQQTRLAAGDFVKTQDSWANQTRILSELWKEFLGVIGTGLIQVLAPVVKALNSLLLSLISIANAFAQVTAKLFGKQAPNAKAKIEVDSSSVDQATAAEEGLADATKKAGKEAKNNTAAFDELNVLSQDTSSSAVPSGGVSSGGGGGIDTSDLLGDTSSTEEEMTAFTKKMLELLKPLQEISFDNLNASLDRLKEALKPFGQVIGVGLQWLYLNVLVPLAKWTIEDLLPAFLDLLSGAIKVITEVIKAFAPFAGWLWDNFLKPIASWTGGIIVSVLSALADILARIATWMSNNQKTVATMATTVGIFFGAWKLTQLIAFVEMSGGIVGALTAITTAIKTGIAAKLIDKAETIYLTLLYAKDAIAKGISTAATIAHTVATTAATAATTAFGIAMTILTSPITLVVLAITALVAIVVLLVKHWDEVKEKATEVWDSIKAAWEKAAEWFETTVVTPIKDFFTKMWDSISNKAASIWTAIKTVFEKASTWFNDTVVKPIAGFFSGLWEGISSKASDVWEDIKKVYKKASTWFDKHVITPISDGFKDGINGIIGFVEGFVNKFIDGVNAIIGALNKIEIDVPDWVPLIGGKNFGFNLSTVGHIDLPKLATGAVIPPNAEFAAILGDQRNGRNLEAPEDLIRQIVREEGGGQEVTINFGGNMAQLIRILKPYIDKENKRKGKVLVKGAPV